jgi:hypothetical protein
MRNLILKILASLSAGLVVLGCAHAAKLHSDHTQPVQTNAPVHTDHTPPVRTDAPAPSGGGNGRPASGWHHQRPPPQQPIPCLGNLC